MAQRARNQPTQRQLRLSKAKSVDMAKSTDAKTLRNSLRTVFETYDSDGSGEVRSRDPLLAAPAALLCCTTQLLYSAAILLLLQIDADELRGIMGSLGHAVSKVEAVAMVKEIDTDGSNTGRCLAFFRCLTHRRKCLVLFSRVELKRIRTHNLMQWTFKNLRRWSKAKMLVNSS